MREEHSGGVFVDLGLIDPHGTQQAYSGPFSLAKADYADAIWFSEAQKNQHDISYVFTGLRGSPHFIIAVKVPWKDPGWILRATVDFNAAQQRPLDTDFPAGDIGCLRHMEQD